MPGRGRRPVNIFNALYQQEQHEEDQDSLLVALFENVEENTQRLVRIERMMKELLRAQQEIAIMAQKDIDALRQTVEANTNVTNSAMELLNGMAAQIRESADDPDELRALADQIEQNSKKLADAVVANSKQPVAPAAPTDQPQG
jgi:aromatic ring hydroxylase